MKDTDPLVLERRTLLRYILQKKVQDGVEILLPVGCTAFEEWLLDAIDVDKLLGKIESERRVDLTLLCDPENSRPVSRRTTLTSIQTEDVTQDGMGLQDAAGLALPRLKVSYLSSQMDDQGLRDIALEVFYACCGSSASKDLMQSLRAQLEISEKRASDLGNLVSKIRKSKQVTITDILAHLELLKIALPSHFQNFRSYVLWRDATTALIQLSLIHAVQTCWIPGEDDDGSYLISVMKGGFRRLDARDADEYNEKEMRDAVSMVSEACQKIASRCRNGREIPWDLKVSFAEVLLRGSFDSLDDGSLIEEVDELEQLLLKKVWPALGISQEIHYALQVWANYRQFFASREISLLFRAASMVEKVNTDKAVAGDVNLLREILDAIKTDCFRVLQDYHRQCDSPEEVNGVIRLLLGTMKAASEECDARDIVRSSVKASVNEIFERKSAEIGDHTQSEQDKVALLATECLEILRAECEDFAPKLQQYLSNSTAVAAATLHEAYGARLLPWIVSTTSLDKNVIATMATAMALEDELLVEMQNYGMDAPVWGVLERVSPQLYQWTKGQIATLREWISRIVQNENWMAQHKSRGATVRSFGETMKASHDVVESLFLMGIPVPAGVVRCMVDGVDGILQGYCEEMMTNLGDVDGIIPPAPPLTRYKKDIMDAAEAIDTKSPGLTRGPGSSEKSTKSIKNITAKAGALFTTSWLPALSNEDKQSILEVPFDSIAVRANSLFIMVEEVSKLKDMVIQRWESGQPKSSKKKAQSSSTEWASGMFSGVESAAARSADYLLHFAAVKLMCGHLRFEIFEQLYRFNIQMSGIAPVLQEIDSYLGLMCEILREELSPRLAGHFCKTLGAAISHVLLDGGPVRWFDISDATLVEQDIDMTESMFFADGDGIDSDSIEKLLKPATDVVEVMAMDTGTIISRLKEAKKHPLSTYSQGKDDPDILLRVLCHRKDHSASKYLKKEYKIQKKLPSIISTSVSKSFSRTPTKGMTRVAAVSS